MDCGFLLTQRNFGPQPWSAWTNRAVCLLAARHILGDEAKTPSQSSRHHYAAHPTSTGMSGGAPPFLPLASPLLKLPVISKLSHTLHFLHSFSSLRPLQPGRGPTAGVDVSQVRGTRKGVLGVGGMSVQLKSDREGRKGSPPFTSPTQLPTLHRHTYVSEWLPGALPLPRGTLSIRPLFGSSPCTDPVTSLLPRRDRFPGPRRTDHASSSEPPCPFPQAS